MKFVTLNRSWPGAEPPAAGGVSNRPGNSSERESARSSRRLLAFTLAEVLAALAFMAIVIPVAVEGLRIANRAGQVSQRKAVAARVGDRVLNEWIVSARTAAPARSGVAEEGTQTYRWTIRTQPWNQDTMKLITVEVIYQVQGQDYDVRVSTLLDNGSS